MKRFIRAEGLIPRPSGAKQGVLNPIAIPYENTIHRCSAAGLVIGLVFTICVVAVGMFMTSCSNGTNGSMVLNFDRGIFTAARDGDTEFNPHLFAVIVEGDGYDEKRSLYVKNEGVHSLKFDGLPIGSEVTVTVMAFPYTKQNDGTSETYSFFGLDWKARKSVEVKDGMNRVDLELESVELKGSDAERFDSSWSYMLALFSEDGLDYGYYALKDNSNIQIGIGLYTGDHENWSTLRFYEGAYRKSRPSDSSDGGFTEEYTFINRLHPADVKYNPSDGNGALENIIFKFENGMTLTFEKQV